MPVLIRGGGDLASGVALRLRRAGLSLVISELAHPLAVRRLVSFSEAVRLGQVTVEGITARRVDDPADVPHLKDLWVRGLIPVLVDPEARAIGSLHPPVVVDARLMKTAVPRPLDPIALLIGLGPGFQPGVNCDAAVETARGPWLGRVYWDRAPLADTGVPETVLSQGRTRVLRAPADGVLEVQAAIGDILDEGQVIAAVGGQPVLAAFRGALRGMLPAGMTVTAGLKIGDLDPRCDPALARYVSDKALAVAGGVLEAMLSRTDLRAELWS
jgi:xanthine dehydrogenase accessory factor